MASKDEVLTQLRAVALGYTGGIASGSTGRAPSDTEIAAHMALSETLVDRLLRAADALGWRLCPAEPSDEMIDEARGYTAWASDEREAEFLRKAYAAMLSASPSLIDE